jgi:putative transposase
MGSKHQKKSNSCPFRGKEKIAVQAAIDAIGTHITITTCGTFVPEDIIITTIGMSLKQYSPTAICKLPNLKFPSGTTYRTCIDTINFDELIEKNFALFLKSTQQFLTPGRSYTFAIDEVTDPYYGEAVPDNEDFVVGSKQKKSTNYFYAYITIYVTSRNRRVTLAVFPIRKSISRLSQIQHLVEFIKSEGYGIRVLLLDRGFFSADIFHYLKNANIPHIMPVRVHGKKMTDQLANEEISEFTHILCENTGNAQEIDIKRYKTTRRKKDGSIETKYRGFVHFGLNWSLIKIKETYRSRFAIESSYRMRNSVRPKTSTRNPVTRYFFTIVSFLLKNVWVSILYENFRKKQRGPIVIVSEWFRFDAFRERFWNYIYSTVFYRVQRYDFLDIG